MRGYAGDTFPTFRVAVTGISTSLCTMRLDIENKYTPGQVVFTKAGVWYTDGDESGFDFQLTSAETAELSGDYMIHFVLSDDSGHDYIRLDGALQVLDYPESGGA
jgi:hypothetical protein